ncbi:MAG: apolipoprotein N-acyltransferase [Smithellaceae bacterium]
MTHPPDETKAVLAKQKNSGYAIFFALLSGFLIFLSFPKHGLGFISWVAFVPLFIALRHALTIRRALLLGFITGFTAHVGLIYWIALVVVNYGYLPVWQGVTVMFLLAAYLGIYIAVFAAGVVFFRQKAPLFLVAPVLWVCLEYLKSHLLTGFPWANLGYSQYLNPPLIQLADVGGVFILSFMILLLNVAFFEVITRRARQTYALAFCVLIIWAGAYAYGVFKIRQVDRALAEAPSMNVSLIQGNIDQSVKWNPANQEKTLNIYEELSSRQPPSETGLIVWPETAVPFLYQDPGTLQARVRELPVATKSWLLFGSMSYASQGQNADYFNSAYLLSPDGETSGKYDKVHLVPYGEYVPLRNVFPFINALTAGIGDFAEGAGYNVLTMGEKKIGVLICYEAILPDAVRHYKRKGAELLVNITNDAWFGQTSAPYQHLSMAVFRSVESRLYLVRAANTGVSAIVDPKGRVTAKTEIFTSDALAGSVQFPAMPTIYAKYGDWFVWMNYFLLIGMILLRMIWRSKHVR